MFIKLKKNKSIIEIKKCCLPKEISWKKEEFLIFKSRLASQIVTQEHYVSMYFLNLYYRNWLITFAKKIKQICLKIKKNNLNIISSLLIKVSSLLVNSYVNNKFFFKSFNSKTFFLTRKKLFPLHLWKINKNHSFAKISKERFYGKNKCFFMWKRIQKTQTKRWLWFSFSNLQVVKRFKLKKRKPKWLRKKRQLSRKVQVRLLKLYSKNHFRYRYAFKKRCFVKRRFLLWKFKKKFRWMPQVMHRRFKQLVRTIVMRQASHKVYPVYKIDRRLKYSGSFVFYSKRGSILFPKKIPVRRNYKMLKSLFKRQFLLFCSSLIQLKKKIRKKKYFNNIKSRKQVAKKRKHDVKIRKQFNLIFNTITVLKQLLKPSLIKTKNKKKKFILNKRKQIRKQLFSKNFSVVVPHMRRCTSLKSFYVWNYHFPEKLVQRKKPLHPVKVNRSDVQSILKKKTFWKTLNKSFRLGRLTRHSKKSKRLYHTKPAVEANKNVTKPFQQKSKFRQFNKPKPIKKKPFKKFRKRFFRRRNYYNDLLYLVKPELYLKKKKQKKEAKVTPVIYGHKKMFVGFFLKGIYTTAIFRTYNYRKKSMFGHRKKWHPFNLKKFNLNSQFLIPSKIEQIFTKRARKRITICLYKPRLTYHTIDNTYNLLHYLYSYKRKFNAVPNRKYFPNWKGNGRKPDPLWYYYFRTNCKTWVRKARFLKKKSIKKIKLRFLKKKITSYFWNFMHMRFNLRHKLKVLSYGQLSNTAELSKAVFFKKLYLSNYNINLSNGLWTIKSKLKNLEQYHFRKSVFNMYNTYIWWNLFYFLRKTYKYVVYFEKWKKLFKTPKKKLLRFFSKLSMWSKTFNSYSFLTKRIVLSFFIKVYRKIPTPILVLGVGL